MTSQINAVDHLWSDLFPNCFGVFLASLKTTIVSSNMMLKTTGIMKMSCVVPVLSQSTWTNWFCATRNILVVEGRACSQFFLFQNLDCMQSPLGLVIVPEEPVCHYRKHGSESNGDTCFSALALRCEMSIDEMWSKYLTNASDQSWAS